jgi:serine/threonine protein kinase
MGNCHRHEFVENESENNHENIGMIKNMNFLDPISNLLDRVVPKNILKTRFQSSYKIKKNFKCQNDLFYQTNIIENIFSGRQFKVKIITKTEIYKMGLEKFVTIFTNEINSLMNIKYLYIESIHEVYYENKGDKMKIFIVTDFVGRKTLLDVINEQIKMKKRFSDLEIKKIIRNLLYSLMKLKASGIIYRNLAPDNIVFKKEEDLNSLSIRNFYFSTIIQNSEKHKYELTGPLLYIAPEILQETAYDFTSDAWSLGIILYMLLTLEHPLIGLKSRSAVLNYIKSGKCFKKYNNLVKFGINPRFIQICEKLLNEDPLKRSTVESILDSREFHVEDNMSELSKYGNYDWDTMDILIAKVKNCPEFHNFVFYLYYNLKDYFLTMEDHFLFDRLYKFIDKNNQGIINKLKIQESLKRNENFNDYIKYGDLMSTLIYTDFFKTLMPNCDSETFPPDFFIVANLIAYMNNNKNNRIALDKVETILLELDIDKSGFVTLEELQTEFRTNLDKNLFQAMEEFKKSKYFIGDFNINKLTKADLGKILFYEHISLVPIK